MGRAKSKKSKKTTSSGGKNSEITESRLLVEKASPSLDNRSENKKSTYFGEEERSYRGSGGIDRKVKKARKRQEDKKATPSGCKDQEVKTHLLTRKGRK